LDIGLFILVLNQLIEIIPKIIPFAELVLYCIVNLIYGRLGLGNFLSSLFNGFLCQSWIKEDFAIVCESKVAVRVTFAFA
jgi:hypothetical protein